MGLYGFTAGLESKGRIGYFTMQAIHVLLFLIASVVIGYLEKNKFAGFMVLIPALRVCLLPPDKVCELKGAERALKTTLILLLAAAMFIFFMKL